MGACSLKDNGTTIQLTVSHTNNTLNLYAVNKLLVSNHGVKNDASLFIIRARGLLASKKMTLNTQPFYRRFTLNHMQSEVILNSHLTYADTSH